MDTAAVRRLALGSRRRLDAGDAPSVGVMHLWLNDIEALADALDAARAEVARLREAMPDAGMLESATLLVSTVAPDSRLWHELSAAAARIRALDAGAGNGASVWTREAPAVAGRYWVVMNRTSPPVRCDVRHDGALDKIGTRPILYGPPITPPFGWREALATTTQEVDNAD